MFTPNREALAWAAGLFDGEGCTYLSRGKRVRDRPTVVLSITQSFDREVLDRFAAAVGDGSVSGPVNESGTGIGPRWNYRLQSTSRSLVALGWLWPWLGRVKRAQALGVIDGFEQLMPGSYSRPSKLVQLGGALDSFRQVVHPYA